MTLEGARKGLCPGPQAPPGGCCAPNHIAPFPLNPIVPMSVACCGRVSCPVYSWCHERSACGGQGRGGSDVGVLCSALPWVLGSAVGGQELLLREGQLRAWEHAHGAMSACCALDSRVPPAAVPRFGACLLIAGTRSFLPSVRVSPDIEKWGVDGNWSFPKGDGLWARCAPTPSLHCQKGSQVAQVPSLLSGHP